MSLTSQLVKQVEGLGCWESQSPDANRDRTHRSGHLWCRGCDTHQWSIQFQEGDRAFSTSYAVRPPVVHAAPLSLAAEIRSPQRTKIGRFACARDLGNRRL